MLELEDDAGRARPASHTAVIGGGLLGMTIALRLANARRTVTLIESAPELGGLATAWEIGGVTWDRYYHVMLESDDSLRGLLTELGLADDVRWTTTRTAFFTDGRLHEFSGVLDFLRFKPLKLHEKLRLGLAIAYASRLTDGKKLEGITARAWLTKLCGARVYAAIWQPLLRAKVGAREADVSAAFIWAIIRRLYGARSAQSKAERFGYVSGGYGHIVRRFAERLQELGVTVQTATRVHEIAPTVSGVAVTLADGSTAFYDEVILTAPAPVVASIVPNLSDGERERLDRIAYGGIVCASVLLDVPLSPHYVTNITDTWVPFTAVISMNAIVDAETFGGRQLVYLPKYVTPDDPLFEHSDEAIRARFLPALVRMHPHLRPEHVRAFRVSRTRSVFPVTTLNYSENVLPFASSIPGLWIVNASQIINGTLAVNQTVGLADRATAEILAAVGA